MKTCTVIGKLPHSSVGTKVQSLQFKLKKLDHQWVMVRQAALIRDKHGDHEPSSWSALLKGGFIAAIGSALAVCPVLIWHGTLKLPGLIPMLIGICLLCLGLHRLTYGLARATRFNRARSRYRCKRRELVAIIRHAERG